MSAITIEPTRCGSRGQLYRVHYEGEVVIASTRVPALDACRALLARGITGRLEVWRAWKTFHDLSVDIEKGARLTVRENAQHGPRFGKWSPLAETAVSRAIGKPCAPVETDGVLEAAG